LESAFLRPLTHIDRHEGADPCDPICRRYAGLVTVRTIAARKDIAFVDYADENASTAAKEGLNNHKLGPGEGEPMRVTFARK
jgi:U2 small nuclear ribonucleoprotein B''